jgi:hypothetical protein
MRIILREREREERGKGEGREGGEEREMETGILLVHCIAKLFKFYHHHAGIKIDKQIHCAKLDL